MRTRLTASVLLFGCLSLCGCILPVTRTTRFVSFAAKSVPTAAQLAHDSVRATSRRLGYVEIQTSDYFEYRARQLSDYPILPRTVDEEEMRRLGMRNPLVASFARSSSDGYFSLRLEHAPRGTEGFHLTVFRNGSENSAPALAERERVRAALTADRRLREVTLGVRTYRDSIDLLPLAP